MSKIGKASGFCADVAVTYLAAVGTAAMSVIIAPKAEFNVRACEILKEADIVVDAPLDGLCREMVLTSE